MVLIITLSFLIGIDVYARFLSAEEMQFDDINCKAKRFHVALEAIPEASMFAEVCAKDSEFDGKPVQILLHGGTYDHTYWDWPNRPNKFSYVLAATARHYVTVNIDRLGYGRSSRPDGSRLSFKLSAIAVNQVVQQIKSGLLGFHPETIILNGHSMGGIIAEIVASNSADVDAIIISGLTQTDPDSSIDHDDVDSSDGPKIQSLFIPAKSDPKFQDLTEAENYLTTAPSVRTSLFHAPDAIDSENVRLEESMKDTMAVAEILAVQSDESSRADYSGRSLYVIGQFDAIACQRQDCNEYLSGSTAHYIVHGAGHSLNLSRYAKDFFDVTFDWLSREGFAP